MRRITRKGETYARGVVSTSTPAGIAGGPFRFMLGATVLCFSGYALLLPVVPLWAERGGSGALGSGATTAMLMATTVATQLAVPWLLVRIGHRWVLAAGSVLLGAPAGGALFPGRPPGRGPPPAGPCPAPARGGHRAGRGPRGRGCSPARRGG